MAVPASNTDNIENFGHCQVQSIYLPNNVIAATQSNMTYYEDIAHVTNFAGALTSAAIVRLVRRDNEVTMYIGAQAGTMANVVLSFATVIPARFRPTSAVALRIPIIDNTSMEEGQIGVTTAGQIGIGVYKTAGTTAADVTAFTAAAGAIFQIAVRWHLLAV